MVEFRECPVCWGYGIKDSGSTCRTCGGSGELMYDKETGRRMTRRELIKQSKAIERSRAKRAIEINK